MECCFDANTNAAVEVTQTVVVTDNQVPVIASNGNKNIIMDAGVCGATVAVSASATDNCVPLDAPTGVCSDNKPLTDIYPVGTTTTIKFERKDAKTTTWCRSTQTVRTIRFQ
jgi:hypothetical protein